jgi:hypothetical protein
MMLNILAISTAVVNIMNDISYASVCIEISLILHDNCIFMQDLICFASFQIQV